MRRLFYSSAMLQVGFTIAALNIGVCCGQSELRVNLGEDRKACFGNEESILLGEDLSISGGESPYSYTWILFDVVTHKRILDDSDLLSSNTSPNPQLFSNQLNLGIQVIIIDRKGLKGEDSLLINYSEFSWTEEIRQTTILEGDSVEIWTGISSNYPILDYSWKPDSFILNGNSPNPIVFPKKSTEYILEATDANGCSVKDSFFVFIAK